MPFFATLNGKPVARARVSAPWTGAWFATVMPHDVADVPSGAVQLKLGTLTLNGTVDPLRTGIFAGEASVAIRAGAGAWSKGVAPKPNHNDGSLKRSTLAQDVASTVGEKLVVSSSADGPLVGVDFPREAAPASRILEQLFPGAVWYVGADGMTRVGDRTTRDVSASVQVLELELGTRTATLALSTEDVGDLLPGGSISDPVRLGSEPFVIHDVEIVLSDASLRATASGRTGRNATLLGAFRQLVRESDPNRTFFGLYRYRVYKMSGDRVELQIVRPTVGLPDNIPLSIMPGIAGASFQLTAGAVVLVQFIEGDPSLPVMTHATKKGDAGFLPVSLTLDASSIAIGPSAGQVNAGAAEAPVLRSGDKVDFVIVPSSSTQAEVALVLATSVIAVVGPPGTGHSKVNA